MSAAPQGPVELADPDPRWPRAAAEEIWALWPLLAPWRDGGVHHVGSTAVAQVPAEPVIDLLAGLADVDQAHAAGAALESVGWRRQGMLAPDGPGAGPCFARARDDGLAVRVALLEPGCEHWRRALLFRDRLRADPQARSTYSRAKRRAARGGDRADYERRKQALVTRVTGLG